MSEHMPEPGQQGEWSAFGAPSPPGEPAEVPWAPPGPTYAEGGTGYVPPVTAPPQSGPEPPPMTTPAGFVPVSAIREIMDQALERQKKSFDAEIAQLRKEQEAERQVIAASTGELGMTVEHGAGVGLERAPTWSFYDQQLAIRGEHPRQKAAADR